MDKKECRDAQLNERPIFDKSKDILDIDSRVVAKIYQLINNSAIKNINIAITGGWGCGKSSAMNLLRNRLTSDRNAIIINFEPLVEGKLEVNEIIELFYLKLLRDIEDNKTKEVIKDCIKSIAAVANLRISARLPELLGGIGVEGNPGEMMNKLMDIWLQEVPLDFIRQIGDLNKRLCAQKLKLYIFIDEIDRLTAGYIINFLLFCRVLETIDNLVCIVGIDYEQVIRKLQNEGSIGTGDYRHAQSYLDKLFQAKFHIHHNLSKKIEWINYIITDDKSFDGLREIINSDHYDVKNFYISMIDYLSTPRQIKKWLITILQNHELIKGLGNDKMKFIKFLAAVVKHPILGDYLSKNGVKFLSERSRFSLFLKEFGIVCLNIEANEVDEIVAASMGLYSDDLKDDKKKTVEKIIEKFHVQRINDEIARIYTVNFFKLPFYLISLYAEGSADDIQVNLYRDYFEENIDNSLIALSSNDPNIDLLADDLNETLRKNPPVLKGVPDISNVNSLWLTKVNSILSPFEIIVLFALYKLPLEVIIDSAVLGLSEDALSLIFTACNFNNKNGIYNLEEAKNPKDEDLMKYGMMGLGFKDIPIKNFNREIIKEIIEHWIEKVNEELKSKGIDVFNQYHLINVFYRYVQWSLAIDENSTAQNSLSSYVSSYLKDQKISDIDKQNLRNIINEEREKFSSKRMGMERDPMEILFNNNRELLDLLE